MYQGVAEQDVGREGWLEQLKVLTARQQFQNGRSLMCGPVYEERGGEVGALAIPPPMWTRLVNQAQRLPPWLCIPATTLASGAFSPCGDSPRAAHPLANRCAFKESPRLVLCVEGSC